ncbi:Sulfate starvation-induced protein 1 [Serratia rubidaea]|uniref:Sulfate starvation-induced protein 1 n=1 Tax=Serratia rubidaea TaxID=61652 RepID=A0A4U9HWV2_SERRU|nr:Sulfate starvation-induced protein 1 [Serratia rubidaea]
MAGKLFSLRGAALLALSLMAASAQAVDVTVAYQTSAEPAKVAQAENSFAKQSGAKVDWRKFDSGSSVLRALASGDVQIGNIGSSPLAVAASQKLPIEVFLIASQLGSSEALVVKNTITSPKESDRQTHCGAVYLNHPLQPAGFAEALGHQA